MTQKIRIGVIFGGRSAEHQVSLVSAGSVMNALDKDKYEVIPIGIAPTGEWLSGPDALDLLKAGQTDKNARIYLPPDPTIKALLPAQGQSLQNDSAGLAETLDVVFPVLHGTFGEDGAIQGLLELAGLPYVGAGVLGSSLSMDKIAQKLVCLQAGLPAPEFLWLRGCDWNKKPDAAATPALTHQVTDGDQLNMVAQIIDTLGLPLFVKPPNMGSSVGISKAHDADELAAGINLALQYDRKVLIEQAVPNAREIEIAVLGNEHPKASVAGEVVPSNEFYDYDAKYVDDASDLFIPAPLDESLQQAIRKTAIQSVLAVEVEGMARVDFLLQKGTDNFYLNEINTIPGFTSISMYPKLWQATGLDYSQLLDELIQLAIDRHRQRSKLNTVYQPKSDWYK